MNPFTRQAGRQAGRQAMSAPQHVLDTVATMRELRGALQGRLDAVELILSNVDHIYPPSAPAPVIGERPRRKYTRRAKPTKKAKVRAQGSGLKVTPKSELVVRANGGDAAARRDTLLELIRKSEVGLTVSELRKATPKMAGPDRSNSLQSLKSTGDIRRAGNTWQKAW